MKPFDEAMWYPTVLEFGEEYVMIHSVERLGKIDVLQYLVSFLRYSISKNAVTLNWGSKVIQGH